jgi:cation diffusion facilitator family transporter
MTRNNLLKTASVISIAGNTILAAGKITCGLAAGSLSVLGDGFDSMTDIFISIITLAVAVIVASPPDREHPYGHHRAETLATAVLAFIIFFIGGQLALSSAGKLINNDVLIMPGRLAVYITVISIIGKILLSYSQHYFGKKAGSEMLLANSKNMQNDIITSSSVLAGLAAGYFFNLPIIDKILAIIIGIWIMITAARIFMGTVTELMEGEVNTELYDKIFAAVKETEGASNPHRVRIKKLGVLYVIDMDIEVNGSMTVSRAHEIVVDLEKRIKCMIPDIYDIIVHVEPEGNVEHTECFGLSENNSSCGGTTD